MKRHIVHLSRMDERSYRKRVQLLGEGAIPPAPRRRMVWPTNWWRELNEQKIRQKHQRAERRAARQPAPIHDGSGWIRRRGMARP